MEKVLNVLRKFNVGFYTGILSVILIIVGLALLSADFSLPYYSSRVSSGLIWLGVLSLVLILVYCILPLFKISNNKIGKTILMLCIVASGVSLTYILFEFLRIRVYDFAVVLGSDLELGNESAFTAVYHSITTIVIFIIALVALIVTSFLNPIKIKEEKVEVLQEN